MQLLWIGVCLIALKADGPGIAIMIQAGLRQAWGEVAVGTVMTILFGSISWNLLRVVLSDFTRPYRTV